MTADRDLHRPVGPAAFPAPPSATAGTVRLLRALLIAAITIPCVMLALASWNEWRRLEREAVDSSARIVAILHEHALKVLQVHEQILDRLDDRLRGMSWDEIATSPEVRRDMDRMIEGLDEASAVLALSPQGMLVTVRPQRDNSDRDYFTVPRDGFAGTYIGEPVMGRVSGQPILNISRARRTADGRFDGVIAVAARQGYFSDFYRSLDPGGDNSVSLIRTDGTVLVRAPGSLRAAVRPGTEIHRVMDEGRLSGTYTMVSLDGVERLLSYRKVAGYPVYVTYGMSLQTLHWNWVTGVAVYALFALLSAASLAAIILLALRRADSEGLAILAWRAETAAREEAETAFEALYTRTPLPLHSINIERRVVGVSDRWLAFLGYDRDEVMGRLITDFMTQDSAVRYLERGWASLMRHGEFHDLDLQFVKRSGEIADVLMSARATYDAAGNFLRTFSVLVDVTDRKRAEAALLQSQKLDAMGKLTGGVAHDFNNLLQALYGVLRMVSRRVGDAQVRQMIETGLKAIDRGARLTGQLTAFARRQPLKPVTRAVDGLLFGMEELLRRSLRDDVGVELDVAPDVWPVCVDPTQLELALINIAVNARDAMPEGGTVRIAACNDTVAGEGALEFVRISVRDTGTGMSADVAARAFEPFFTTKDLGKGTGLGLSMVYGFASQSGGTATIDSAIGRGTTVTLLLPRSQAAPEETVAAPASATRDSGTVLVVDDDAAVAAATLALVAELGYEALIASSPAEALDVLRSGRSVDVVLSDIVMAGGSGIELAREIERVAPRMPVVLATGYSDAAQSQPLRWPVLRKPYSLDQLASVLRDVRRDASVPAE
jgi:PAS domain S-box-containing protein